METRHICLPGAQWVVVPGMQRGGRSGAGVKWTLFHLWCCIRWKLKIYECRKHNKHFSHPVPWWSLCVSQRPLPGWCGCEPDGRPRLSVLCQVTQQSRKLVHNGGIYLLRAGQRTSTGWKKCGQTSLQLEFKSVRVSLPLTQQSRVQTVLRPSVFWVERQNGPNCPKFLFQTGTELKSYKTQQIGYS
jgi:hypothetical protein